LGFGVAPHWQLAQLNARAEYRSVGDVTKIKLLLAAGAAVESADYDKRTCLHLAASEGNIHVVQALIGFSVDINIRDRWGGTPLADAVREGQLKVGELLRSRGAELGWDEVRCSSGHTHSPRLRTCGATGTCGA
jgi:ankyrin repeat protein